MRIIDNTDTSVEFYAVKVGDCFMFDNCLFIKIDPTRRHGYEKVGNALDLVTYTITNVPEACLVTPVNAEIVIRSKGEV